MTTKNITGNVIDGNYIDAPCRSCKPVDYPTKERIEVTIDGKTYERTVYQRVIWRAMGENTLVAEFVIVNGTNYEVAEVEDSPLDGREAIEVLDEDDSTGETLYAVRILTGDVISVIVDADGTEHFNDDWQGKQPQTFDDVRNGYWRWYLGEDIDF